MHSQVNKDELDAYCLENLTTAKYAYKSILTVDDKVVAPHHPVSSIARIDGKETNLIVTLPTPPHPNVPSPRSFDLDDPGRMPSPTRPST